MRMANRGQRFTICKSGGKRAAEVFEKHFPKEDRKGQEVYESHYNIRLNRCFLLEENTSYTRDQGKTYKTRELTLFDANANKIYGSFSPSNCDVLEKKCRSEQEFLTLIRQYMED